MAAIDSYPDVHSQRVWRAATPDGSAVSADFFSLLGVRMALGAISTAERNRPGRSDVIILGYSAWQSYFWRSS